MQSPPSVSVISSLPPTPTPCVYQGLLIQTDFEVYLSFQTLCSLSFAKFRFLYAKDTNYLGLPEHQKTETQKLQPVHLFQSISAPVVPQRQLDILYLLILLLVSAASPTTNVLALWLPLS